MSFHALGGRRHRIVVVLIVLLALGGVIFYAMHPWRRSGTRVRIGITPYQDTALLVVPERLGWYAESGIAAEFVPLAWGDVMLALSSGAIDVSIYTIGSFQAPYHSAALAASRPVFYCPIYVFKGTAIMVRRDSGMTPFSEVSGESLSDRARRIGTTAAQLRGKRIAVTKGTEFEQIVLAALERGNLNPTRDVTLIHSSPEDALAAFLSRDVDAFGAGLTERMEARKRGGVEFLVAANVGQPSIDGVVTLERTGKEQAETLDKVVKIWFRTIAFMESDLKTNSKYVLEYLAGKASTRYTPEEYSIAWTFNVFPREPSAASEVFGKESSPYYWKRAWGESNDFLIKQNQIKTAVPLEAYWGERVLGRLTGQ